MSTPLANIGIVGSKPPEPVQPVAPAAENPVGLATGKKNSQGSPFGPDYIVQTSNRAPDAPVPKEEESPSRVAKKGVAGVVPFTARTGPATDLAALPPLEPLGTEALTELSLNKLMQPSNKAGML